MLKKILFGVVALIVLLVAVILFRTFTYGGAATGERVELPPVPEVSADRAASHLSEAI
jgi:carboxypeptidase PM20D1